MRIGQELKNRTEPNILKFLSQSRVNRQELVAGTIRMLTLLSEKTGAKAKEDNGLVNRVEEAPAQTAKLFFMRRVAPNAKVTVRWKKQMLEQCCSEKTSFGRLASEFFEPQ